MAGSSMAFGMHGGAIRLARNTLVVWCWVPGQVLLYHLAWVVQWAGLLGTLCLYIGGWRGGVFDGTWHGWWNEQTCEEHFVRTVEEGGRGMYKQSVPCKPACAIVHAKCHSRPCPAEAETTKSTADATGVPGPMCLAPITHQHRAHKVFLASTHMPLSMPQAIIGRPCPGTHQH
jgi:hypothetical protein